MVVLWSLFQKDEMSSGKVVELVCLLKRKDNRTFGRFLQALEDMHMTNLVELFKSKASVSGKIPARQKMYADALMHSLFQQM